MPVIRLERTSETGNKANIRELNQIGDNVSIGTLSVIEHHVTIENGVRIHTQAFIPEYSVLKKNAWIRAACRVHQCQVPPFSRREAFAQGPHDRGWRQDGANATLLPGVTVGEDALVGAGSVVTQDVPRRAS